MNLTQTVTDEAGRSWLVQPGDPAAKALLALKRRGFQQVVLPVYTLMSGDPTAAGDEDPLPSSNPAALRVLRMQDCLHVLRRELS